MDEYTEIKNIFDQLTTNELKDVKNRLLTFAKEQDYIKLTEINSYNFFENSNREYYEIDEIQDYIRVGIIDIGIYQMSIMIDEAIGKKTKKRLLEGLSFDVVHSDIINWRRANGINNIKSQCLNVVEMFGKIQLAKNKEEFEDAIGNMLVTLIILNDISQRLTKEKDEVTFLHIDAFLKAEEEDLFSYAKEKGKIRAKVDKDLIDYISIDIIIELSRIAEYINNMNPNNKEDYNEKIHLCILEIVRYVIYLAKIDGTDYIESLQRAYNNTLNKTDKTMDGVFVKEADMQ